MPLSQSPLRQTFQVGKWKEREPGTRSGSPGWRRGWRGVDPRSPCPGPPGSEWLEQAAQPFLTLGAAALSCLPTVCEKALWKRGLETPLTSSSWPAFGHGETELRGVGPGSQQQGEPTGRATLGPPAYNMRLLGSQAWHGRGIHKRSAWTEAHREQIQHGKGRRTAGSSPGGPPWTPELRGRTARRLHTLRDPPTLRLGSQATTRPTGWALQRAWIWE